MLLAAALAAVTALVVASVLLPLLKGGRALKERAAFDRAVYRDQLKELERDEARGLIAAREAAGARLEIERRLLAADTAHPAAPVGPSGGSPLLAVALALLLPAAAALLYLWVGSPGMPDQPYAARERERAIAAGDGHEDLEQTARALAERLKANPASERDWLLLAGTAAALGHWQQSAEAYREALRLSDGRADVAASYGEMLVMAAGGIVTPEAQDALAAALKRDPQNAEARYYLALGQAQQGNAEAAIDAWQKLAAEQPAPSPLRTELKTRITEAARAAGIAPPPLAPAAGPSTEQMEAAAALPPEQRQQLIRGMVEQLAQKLAASPGDLEGWLRLGRAWRVLGERDKAADAYEHAAELKPEDAELPLAAAEALIPDGAPTTPVPERAVALLKRAAALDPKQQAALWYLGLAAAQQRQLATATQYWERLLAELPAGGQHDAVAAALEAIRGK